MLLMEIEIACRDWIEKPIVPQIFRSLDRQGYLSSKHIKEIQAINTHISSLFFINSRGKEVFRWSKKENPYRIPYSNGFFVTKESSSLYLGIPHQNGRTKVGFVIFEIPFETLFHAIARSMPKTINHRSIVLISPHMLALTDHKSLLRMEQLHHIHKQFKTKNMSKDKIHFPDMKTSAYQVKLFPKQLSFLYTYKDNPYGIPYISLAWLLFLTLNSLLFFYLNFYAKEHDLLAEKEASNSRFIKRQAPSFQPPMKTKKKSTKKTNRYDFDLSKSIPHNEEHLPRAIHDNFITQVPDELYKIKKTRLNKQIVSLLKDINDPYHPRQHPIGDLNFPVICSTLLNHRYGFSKNKDNVHYVRSLLKDQKIHSIVLFEKQKNGSYKPFQFLGALEKNIHDFILKPQSNLMQKYLLQQKPILIQNKGSFKLLIQKYFRKDVQKHIKKFLFFPIYQEKSLAFILSVA